MFDEQLSGQQEREDRDTCMTDCWLGDVQQAEWRRRRTKYFKTFSLGKFHIIVKRESTDFPALNLREVSVGRRLNRLCPHPHVPKINLAKARAKAPF